MLCWTLDNEQCNDSAISCPTIIVSACMIVILFINFAVDCMDFSQNYNFRIEHSLWLCLGSLPVNSLKSKSNTLCCCTIGDTEIGKLLFEIAGASFLH